MVRSLRVRSFDFPLNRLRLPAIAVWLVLLLVGGFGAPGLAGLLNDGRPLALLLSAGDWALPEFAAPLYEYQDLLAVLLVAVVAGGALFLVYRSVVPAIGLLLSTVATAVVGLAVVGLVLFRDGYVADLVDAGPSRVALATAIVAAASLVFRLAVGVEVRLLTRPRPHGEQGDGETDRNRRSGLIGQTLVGILPIATVLAGSLGLTGMPSGRELGLALAIALVLDTTAVRAFASTLSRLLEESRRASDSGEGFADARTGASMSADGAQPADPWEHRPLEWMHRTLGGPAEFVTPVSPEPPPDRRDAPSPAPEPAVIRRSLNPPADRQLTTARLAVLKTSTAILTSGGRPAEPDDVLVLAERLEAWVYRQREPAGVSAAVPSSRPLWQQIATNKGS